MGEKSTTPFFWDVYWDYRIDRKLKEPRILSLTASRIFYKESCTYVYQSWCFLAILTLTYLASISGNFSDKIPCSQTEATVSAFTSPTQMWDRSNMPTAPCCIHEIPFYVAGKGGENVTILGKQYTAELMQRCLKVSHLYPSQPNSIFNFVPLPMWTWACGREVNC